MATKPNGEPHVSTINFGSYYVALWRMDDDEPWRFLVGKDGSRRVFASAHLAITEAIRLKRKPVAVDAEPSEDSVITTWRADKLKEDENLRLKVFGSGRPKIVFCNGRAVTVETKARARA